MLIYLGFPSAPRGKFLYEVWRKNVPLEGNLLIQVIGFTYSKGKNRAHNSRKKGIRNNGKSTSLYRYYLHIFICNLQMKASWIY